MQMSQDFLHNYCGKSHLIDIFIFSPDLFELFLTTAAKKVLYIKLRRGKHCVIVSSYLQSQLEKCFLIAIHEMCSWIAILGVLHLSMLNHHSAD